MQHSNSIMFDNFNSIKVRLEHKVDNVYELINDYFNSIKVRLEQTKATSIVPRFLFQFHKGTIRTLLFAVCSRLHVISIP